MTFLVSKAADGAYRWTLISSNSYRDSDGEIVSQKAHEADIERMESTGNYGQLNWEHTYFDVSGDEPVLTTIRELNFQQYIDMTNAGQLISLDLGDCDTSLMVGKFRVESGTFYDNAVGKSLAESDEQFTVSVEFFNTGKDADGAYDAVYTFKRSLLSSAVAPANALTGAIIKDADMDWKRIWNFRNTVGDDVALATLEAVDGLDARAVMAAIESKEKEMGVEEKALVSREEVAAIVKELSDEQATAIANVLKMMDSVSFDVYGYAYKEVVGKSAEERADLIAAKATTDDRVVTLETALKESAEVAAKQKADLDAANVKIAALEKSVEGLGANVPSGVVGVFEAMMKQAATAHETQLTPEQEAAQKSQEYVETEVKNLDGIFSK